MIHIDHEHNVNKLISEGYTLVGHEDISLGDLFFFF
jgi:hypothetical protein